MTMTAGDVLPIGAPVRPIRDLLRRPLRDVRISVTDRCNFRCTYCMPRSSFGPGHRFLPREGLLSADDIGRLATVLVRLGVRKIRLTGGEPLLRSDLDEIVARVAATGAPDVALTTNGSLLTRWAVRLRRAGLHRLTVSLDALDPDVHARTSDSGVSVDAVLEGIRAARDAGFAPIKINAVIRRGVNEDAVEALVEFARTEGHRLRFIEYMDVGESNHWSPADVLPAAEIIARVAALHPLEPPRRHDPSDVAQTLRFADGRGETGVIASVTQPFCGACTRLRVSADGRLYTCLFASRGTDLRPALAAGEDALASLLEDTWRARADRYSETRGTMADDGERVEMSYIGG